MIFICRCESSDKCIPDKWRCDQFDDCPDASDELNCDYSDADESSPIQQKYENARTYPTYAQQTSGPTK